MAQRVGLPDYHYVLQQSTAAALGLVALVVCARLPIAVWQTLAWPLLAATWVALILLLLPWTHGIAPEINGARRWLRIGVSFQPSEVAKLAVLVWSAGMAVRKAPHFRSLSKGLMPFLVVWGAVLIPIALEPDFSTAALIAILGCVIVFTAGARLGHFFFMCLCLSPFMIAQLSVDFRAQRVRDFVAALFDPSQASFQVHQSLIAVGSGGLTGLGFAKGRQKFGFLPEPHTDFMFSMVGEEWGFIGVVLLVLMYLALVLIGFRIARRAPTAFSEYLAVGCASFIAVHATLHMFVGLALVPSTGLPLPLVSYGRSNMVITLAVVGILMAVDRAGSRAEVRGRRRRTARA